MEKEKIDYLIRYYLHLLLIRVIHRLKYLYLNEKEREIEKGRLAEVILEESEDEVFWNLCPKCNGLARTPQAKQCRHCYFDWH